MPDFALRIADASKGSGEFRVELSFDNGLLVRTSATEFNFSVSARDQELVRWYWEDFVEYPDRVAQRKAARVEQRLREIGDELFRQVFDPPAARQFWSEIQPRLGETRIEIVGSQRADFTLLPWEFLRDPNTGALLAEGCTSFVRRSKATRLSSRDWSSQPGPLRVLLVMWQPPADPQLPFRPTARRLLQALSREARGRVSVDILRPPTYGQLNTVLLEAEAMDQPYHLLQFDGYGIFTDAANESGVETHSLQSLRGSHGYLISDNSTWERTRQLLDGGALGDLMIEARVPWLVLNACRGSGTSAVGDAERDDVAQPGCLRAFHSLALDALEKGIAGVLQLPYHLGSAASAQFLLKTYLNLAQGRSLAEAATQHRKWLREQAERQPKGLPFLGWDLAERKWQRSQPESDLTFGWVRREDWLVPVIYEPLPFRLEALAEPENAAVSAQAEAGDAAESAEPEIGDSQLPSHDAPGFFGRDDILLAIDSLWQRHSVVLLHGDAATGKTETAVEFARWYREVGGVRSTVLYTSFEHYKPVAALLDQLATVFAPVLRKAGQPWESLDLEKRLEIALELLNKAPVLWIWDAVEHLAESAAGAAWSAQEQEEFVNFLRAAHETQAKFLLVSRHEEKQWLRDLPVRFGIPPLPIRERLQLTRALMEQHGLRLKNVEDWQAVFEFSEGNPLAIRFLVEQALAENLRTRSEIDQFVARVRQAAPQAPQAGSAGLAEPLQVTLRYIQHNAFNEGERKILALLRLFPGRVSAELLAAMGGAGSEKTWLPELQEIREFQELRAGAGSSVLDRAAAVGLLHTEGENRYTTHPALQWFFQELFEECYPVAARSPKTAQRGSLALSAPPETKAPPPAPKKERESGWDAAGKSLRGALGQWSSRGAFLGFGGSREEGPAARAGRAYVEVIGAFAVACAKRAEAGDAAALRELNTQESNLHHACRLACQLEWWSMAAKAARGLGVLYETGGRFAQWEALLEQLTPLCVERITQQSLPGREEFWRVVIGQGARLAHKNRKLTRAEKLQELCVRWDRQKAGSRDEKAGSKDEMATLSEDDDRETQRSLAGSLYSLSTILREQGTPSVKVDEEAVALRERLGEKKPASAWAYEIGQSYTEAPEIRELSQAERWLKRGLELISEDDRPGKAKCLAQLGRVAWVRFNEARRGDRPEAELRRYLNDARMYYQAALEYDPPDDFPKLAQHHEELGHIGQAVGDFERAFPHYREAIRYHDLSEDHRSAGYTRFNLAIDLRNANRLAEARKYALAARENLERSGSSEHDIMRRIQMLLESIDQKLQAKRGLQ